MKHMLIVLTLLVSLVSGAEPIKVGSKAFTEGYLSGELIAQKLEASKFQVTRKFGLGQTGVLSEALKSGDIDLYPEYTGTISEAILKKPELKEFDEIQNALAPLGLEMSLSLGFNNTYAVAVTKAFADKYNLRTISDLAAHTADARVGFSHEFMSRADGYRALSKAYDLSFATTPQAMEHSLSYQAVESGRLDVIDVYSTDAKIQRLGLVVLQDDRSYFPTYNAVILARKTFIAANPAAWQTLRSLELSLSEEQVQKLNGMVDLDRLSFQKAVEKFLDKTASGSHKTWRAKKELSQTFETAKMLGVRTKEHLFLVMVALLFSIAIGIPLGVLATKQRVLGQGILLLSGTIQTIPSLALLCFLIPLFGIGTTSALIALCLYGLLPVVMNTFIGLQSIEPSLIEMTYALKLSRWQSLWRIQLPLASRNILAGIRTSAVIGIGTATLAALIGAGGYGAIIVSGLAINDNNMILMGAIPAAVMALAAHGLFELLGRVVIPRGLR